MGRMLKLGKSADIVDGSAFGCSVVDGAAERKVAGAKAKDEVDWDRALSGMFGVMLGAQV